MTELATIQPGHVPTVHLTRDDLATLKQTICKDLEDAS